MENVGPLGAEVWTGPDMLESVALVMTDFQTQIRPRLLWLDTVTLQKGQTLTGTVILWKMKLYVSYFREYLYNLCSHYCSRVLASCWKNLEKKTADTDKIHLLSNFTVHGQIWLMSCVHRATFNFSLTPKTMHAMHIIFKKKAHLNSYSDVVLSGTKWCDYSRGRLHSLHGQLQPSIHYQNLSCDVGRLQKKEDSLGYLLRLAKSPQGDGTHSVLLPQLCRHVGANKTCRGDRAGTWGWIQRNWAWKRCIGFVPGASKLTLILREATSLAKERVKPSKPALLAL